MWQWPNFGGFLDVGNVGETCEVVDTVNVNRARATDSLSA